MVIKGQRFIAIPKADSKDVEKSAAAAKNISLSSPEPDRRVLKDSWTKGQLEDGGQFLKAELKTKESAQESPSATSVPVKWVLW